MPKNMPTYLLDQNKPYFAALKQLLGWVVVSKKAWELRFDVKDESKCTEVVSRLLSKDSAREWEKDLLRHVGWLDVKCKENEMLICPSRQVPDKFRVVIDIRDPENNVLERCIRSKRFQDSLKAQVEHKEWEVARLQDELSGLRPLLRPVVPVEPDCAMDILNLANIPDWNPDQILVDKKPRILTFSVLPSNSDFSLATIVRKDEEKKDEEIPDNGAAEQPGTEDKNYGKIGKVSVS